MPLVFLDTLNPPRGLMIDVDKIEAIHGVLGFVPAGKGDGAFCRMRAGEKPGRAATGPKVGAPPLLVSGKKADAAIAQGEAIRAMRQVARISKDMLPT